MRTDYRADIDGLRGLAVLAVVVFHLGWGLSGGYVGVDVFFVISGFLITRLIVLDLDRGVFSLAGFWDRRLRRIWPAATVVTIATLVSSWWLLLPGDFADVAADAVAQLAMLANVRYWMGTDYFATNAELRPLLHTWSLAVEEQFYIFFPLFMAWGRQRGRAVLLTCLAGLFTASFAASAVAMHLDRMAVFFLLPFRAWELLCGALVALLPLPGPSTSYGRQALAIVGAALVLAPMFLYDHTTQFPAWAALPPCLGTAFVIAAGPAATPNRLLALSPLRPIGLVSYSMYLWHWPVLAFARYCFGVHLPVQTSIAAAAATAALSYLSWRFIEQPFRVPKPGPSVLRTASTAIAVSAGVAGLAMAVYCNDGFPQRFPPHLAAFAASRPVCRTWSTEQRVSHEGPALLLPIGARGGASRPCFLLWGDSHGMAISEAVDRLATKELVSGVACLRGAGCPVPGVWRPSDRGGEAARLREKQHGEAMLEWIRTVRPRNVILVARWSEYLAGGKTDQSEDFQIAPVDSRSRPARGSGPEILRDALSVLLHACNDADARLHILLPVPTQIIGPKQRAIQAFLTGQEVNLLGVDRQTHSLRQAPMRFVLQEFAESQIHIVDLALPFFDATGASCVGARDCSWYWDDDHINTLGANAVLDETLLNLVRAVKATCSSVRKPSLDSAGSLLPIAQP